MNAAAVDHLNNRPRGRLELRRERLLEVGERIFLHKGYAGASVNEIVRLAGGSLATLYNEFGSKEGLFAEIMQRRASSVFDCDATLCATKSKTPRVALLALASRLLERRLSEDSLALYRIAVSEGPRFPELRKAIVDINFTAFIRTLAEIIVNLKLATPKESGDAAENFVSLVHGQLLFRAACGNGDTISAQHCAKHAARAVDSFLQLYPPRIARKRVG